jgi:hypothetical protein
MLHKKIAELQSAYEDIKKNNGPRIFYLYAGISRRNRCG